MKRLNFQVAIPTVEDLTNALEGAHPDAPPEWGRSQPPRCCITQRTISTSLV